MFTHSHYKMRVGECLNRLLLEQASQITTLWPCQCCLMFLIRITTKEKIRSV